MTADRRGFRVSPLSREEYADIIETRAVVEIHALRESIRVDLLVIGAYSHARSAEMIFGGVTRTLGPPADPGPGVAISRPLSPFA